MANPLGIEWDTAGVKNIDPVSGFATLASLGVGSYADTITYTQYVDFSNTYGTYSKTITFIISP